MSQHTSLQLDPQHTTKLIDALRAEAANVPEARWAPGDLAPAVQAFIEAFNACSDTLARRGAELCEQAEDLAQSSRASLSDIEATDRGLGNQLGALPTGLGAP